MDSNAATARSTTITRLILRFESAFFTKIFLSDSRLLNTMMKILNFFALLLYSALIYWLSDQSTLPMPLLFENQDKLQHFIAYFLMGLIAWRSFYGLSPRGKPVFWLAFGYCCLYGLSDEWHQSFVAGRTSSGFDWLADSLGGLLATAGLYWRSEK